MRQILLLAGACGVAGGLVGAGLVLWLGARQGAGAAQAPAPQPVAQAEGTPAAGAGGADVLRRLESVERRLGALSARTAPAPAAAGPAPGEPASAAIGDPVFEAAVLDVLERAEDERGSERSERRKERARQQAEHWAQELTERLELSPQQAASLTEIRAQLQAELREQGSSADGRFVPRAERRAARAALRERAEQQLRAVLQPRQVAGYEQLGGELKLVRPSDAD